MIQRFSVIFLTLLLVIPSRPSPVAASSNQISKDFEKGLSVAMEAMKELGTVDDPEKLKRLDEIGYRVAQASAEDKPYFSFHIVRMEEPNAFALPGGYIFVSSGMLDLDLTDDEMAALVGHEITHVRNDHSHKMAKRQTLMNLLYQALIVGIAFGIKEGNQGVDPITGLRDRSNKSEILQGSAAFGLVFQELLMRGFSRDLELEADHEGMIAAAHAGFSPEGTSQLFEKMRKRIYEAPGYGYLRTHPYFEDRVAAARALAPNLQKAKNPPDSTEYRMQTQVNLLHSLENFKKDDEKKIVRKIALNAWPKGKSADELRSWFIDEAENSENSKEVFFRDYGRLIKLYQDSLKQMKDNNTSQDLVEKLEKNLTKIQQDKEAILPSYEEVLGRQMFDTDTLRRYISNFPDSPRLSEVRYRLAENYRILKKNSEAVDLYLAVIQPASESIWKEKSKESLMQMVSSLGELSSCYKIMQQASDLKLKEASEERMKVITAKFDSLQNGYEFRRNYPTSTYEKPVRAQMTKLAAETLNQAKLYQAVGEYQKALDHYNKILRYCSDLPVADQVKESIVDFQELETVKS